jgi:DNA-3-methyladenine glycosylase
MFAPGGVSYVYLCYGVHHLLNLVVNKAELPEAVLIRGLQPLFGLEEMRQRRGFQRNDCQLASGPGKLTAALGIGKAHNRLSLAGECFKIFPPKAPPTPSEIRQGPRIGVEYAGQDAWLPYRFWLANNPNVSVQKHLLPDFKKIKRTGS